MTCYPLSFSPAMVGELANKMLGFNLTTKQTSKEGVKVKTVSQCADNTNFRVFRLGFIKFSDSEFDCPPLLFLTVVGRLLTVKDISIYVEANSFQI